MPSNSYLYWLNVRSRDLDEMAQAHAAVGGTQRGRRYATQQINRSYAVLLASQFQGFCRDLHSECVDYLTSVQLPAILQPIVRAEFTRNRQLDNKNAQPNSIGSDFDRLGLSFWAMVEAHRQANRPRRETLSRLNSWRIAIVHQSFDKAKLGGTTNLLLKAVKLWRRDCDKLAQSFDEVMKSYLQSMIGQEPW